MPFRPLELFHALDHVDFMAADAHKWMLGPCAAGLMVVKESMQDVLQPTTFGWHNVQCPDFVAVEDLILAPDARRYEAGSHNSMGIVGLHASLQLLQRIGTTISLVICCQETPVGR